MSTPAPLRKPVVLLIEPDHRLRTALSLILSRAGYACLTATSEADGAALLESQRCNVLVAHVPSVRHTLARWLQSLNENGLSVPTVVITEDAETFSPEIQAALGVSAVVPTPIVPARLVSAITKACPLPEGAERDPELWRVNRECGTR